MNTKDAIRKLVELLWCHYKDILFITFFLLISSGLSLCIPLISKQIMDEGFIGGNLKLLTKLVLLSFIIYVLNALVDVIKEKKRVDIVAKIRFYLAEQSFSHLLKLKVKNFEKTNSAEIMNNVNTDIEKISSIADNSVFFIITQIFSITGGIVGLLIIDFRLTVIVLAFIPLKYFIMKALAKKQRNLIDSYIIKNQQYAKWFGDTVGGLKEIRFFDMYKRKLSEFSESQNNIVYNQKQINMLMQWNITFDIMIFQLLTAFIYIIGANLVFNLELSVGSVFAFITFCTYVISPISAILNISYFLSGIIPSVIRFNKFMDLDEENDSGNLQSICLGDISYNDVTFSYDTERYVLNDINIVFKEGKKTALMGGNGSGKSTLIALLLRLYAPTKGRICLNGIDINEFSLYEYRNIISIVSQQIYLFDDTIYNNICLNKQIEYKLLISAIEDSELMEFVQEVSLNYIVGNNGEMLSGGQKQKIALARALVHDKKILIFDEATSNVDVTSEKYFYKLLNTRLKEKTVIIVTHRLDILSYVDEVVTLKDGKIAQNEYEQ